MKMKKFFVIALMCILTLSVAACGAKEAVQDAVRDAISVGSEDSENTKNDPNTKSNEAALEIKVDELVEDAVEHDAFSMAAATAFWNDKGIDVEAAAPDWEWIIDEEKMTTYGDEPDSAYGHASIAFEKADGGELSEEEFRAWAEKMFSATAAASDDGYNIVGWEFAGDGEDALSQVSFDDAFGGGFMQGWGFMRNGRNMVVYIGENYTTDKDSEIGRSLYNYAVSADVCFGLEKSLDDALSDAEAAFEENEDEIKEALDDYRN
jgi:hypothetical protein